MKKKVLILLSALSVLISCNRSTSPSVSDVDSLVDSTSIDITESVFISSEVEVYLPISLTENDGLALYDQLREAFFQKEYNSYLITNESNVEYNYNYSFGELGNISVQATESRSLIQYANFINLYLSEILSEKRSISALDLPYTLDISSETNESIEYYDYDLQGVVNSEIRNGTEDFHYFTQMSVEYYTSLFKENRLEKNGAIYDSFSASDLEEVLESALYYRLDFYTNQNHDNIRFELEMSLGNENNSYLYDITALISDDVFEISGVATDFETYQRQKARIDLFK